MTITTTAAGDTAQWYSLAQLDVELDADDRAAVGRLESRLRRRVIEQRTSGAILHFFRDLRAGLIELGLPIDSQSLQIVNRNGTDWVCVHDRLEDLRTHLREGLLDFVQGEGDQDPNNAAKHPWVLEVWRNGRVRYDGQAQLVRPGEPVSVADVPFACGTLGLQAYRGSAYSLRDLAVVAALSQVVSEAFRRFLDLLALRDAKRHLTRSRQVLELAQDIAEVGHWTWDRTTGEVAWSEGLYRIFGLDPAQVPPSVERYWEMVHPEDREQAQRAAATMFERRDALHASQHRILRADGEERVVRARGRVSRWSADAEPVFVIGSTQDITDLARAQEARHTAEQSLRESSRLIAMGQMAAAMAHELNQPLTVVNTLAEGMQLRLESGREIRPEQQQEWSRETLQAIERMRRVIEHLRDFARDHRADARAPVRLASVVDDALTFVGAQLSSRGIRLDVEMGALAEVHGDAHQLEQILINLLTNARDAVEARAATQSGEMHITVRGRQDGDDACIEVDDNGVGLPPEIEAQRLFDPFVTTKGSAGLGLGLAICSELAAEHGGSLEVESLSPGTRFRLRLSPAPAADSRD